MIIHEGGYVSDPADSGGETKYGISKRSYPNEDIAALTVDDAKAIYLRDFWKTEYEQISDQQLANKVFDFSVNMGAASAVRLLQRAINFCGWGIAEDGIFGPETLKRVNGLPASNLIDALKLTAANHYRAIVAAKPEEEKFLRGWLARAAA